MRRVGANVHSIFCRPIGTIFLGECGFWSGDSKGIVWRQMSILIEGVASHVEKCSLVDDGWLRDPLWI